MIQAIYQRRYTEVATFTGVPSKETRETLAKYGYTYRNGQWVKSHVESSIITEEEVASAVAS